MSNYAKPTNFRNTQYPKILTERQSNIIVGLMLGDGNIRKVSDSCNARMKVDRAIKDHRYNLWLADELKELTSDKAIRKFARYDERTNKTYKGSCLQTRTCQVLNDYYANWYPAGEKHLPREFTLTKETMAVWFCDDGFLQCTTPFNIHIAFATGGFTRDEVLRLQKLLMERYDQIFTVSKASTKKEQFNIHGAKDACNAVLAEISPLIMDMHMKRKLKLITERDALFSKEELAELDRLGKQSIGFHKVSEKQVLEIRAFHTANRYSIAELASQYGVGYETIREIVKRITWTHI